MREQSNNKTTSQTENKRHKKHNADKKKTDRNFLKESFERLVLLLAVPFLVVVATTLKNGVVLAVISFLVMIPMVILHHLLKNRLSLPSLVVLPGCCLFGMLIISPSHLLVRLISPEAFDALGGYLYLMSVYAALLTTVFDHPQRPLGGEVLLTLRRAGVFSISVIAIGALREWIAYGQLWGVAVPVPLRLEAAKMSFFGFLLLGMLLALTRAVKQWGKALRSRRFWQQKKAAALQKGAPAK